MDQHGTVAAAKGKKWLAKPDNTPDNASAPKAEEPEVQKTVKGFASGFAEPAKKTQASQKKHERQPSYQSAQSTCYPYVNTATGTRMIAQDVYARNQNTIRLMKHGYAAFVDGGVYQDATDKAVRKGAAKHNTYGGYGYGRR